MLSNGSMIGVIFIKCSPHFASHEGLPYIWYEIKKLQEANYEGDM